MNVRLEKLRKTFGESVVAVKSIDLEIASGEFTVFLGPSGCGKTTTLRMIAGLETPDSGSIYIGDRLVTYLPPKDRNVAMVFQRFSLYPSMTVFQNIAFPLEVHKRPRAEIEERVHQVAKLVHIEHTLKRRPSQVSGGEAQRVALARMMVRDPDVFLMDEPLSNLDAKLRVELRTELKRLHAEVRRTTIFVTHDQEEAMTLGDRIVVMNGGEIQQVGDPREIFFRPRNAFVASFVGLPSMNMFPGELEAQGSDLAVRTPSFTCPLPARLAQAARAVDVQKVTWGVRPDTIKLVQESNTWELAGKAEVVELLGTRQLIYADVNGAKFNVMTDSTHHVSPGDPCYFHFEDESVFLFDAQTGESVMYAAELPMPAVNDLPMPTSTNVG
jgi:multiple sugar transport system ATP-binding protein